MTEAEERKSAVDLIVSGSLKLVCDLAVEDPVCISEHTTLLFNTLLR